MNYEVVVQLNSPFRVHERLMVDLAKRYPYTKGSDSRVHFPCSSLEDADLLARQLHDSVDPSPNAVYVIGPGFERKVE